MKTLPGFNSPEEFADFVDGHDMGEYWDELDAVTDVEFARPALVQISVKVSGPLLEALTAQAAAERMPLPALVRHWLHEYAREHRLTPEAEAAPVP